MNEALNKLKQREVLKISIIMLIVIIIFLIISKFIGIIGIFEKLQNEIDIGINNINNNINEVSEYDDISGYYTLINIFGLGFMGLSGIMISIVRFILIWFPIIIFGLVVLNDFISYKLSCGKSSKIKKVFKILFWIIGLILLSTLAFIYINILLTIKFVFTFGMYLLPIIIISYINFILQIYILFIKKYEI